MVLHYLETTIVKIIKNALKTYLLMKLIQYATRATKMLLDVQYLWPFNIKHYKKPPEAKTTSGGFYTFYRKKLFTGVSVFNRH